MNAELHVPLTNGLVSIVMPSYHALNTLQRSVSGIQSQTYSNWELLLIVDGSVDGTVALAKPWRGRMIESGLWCREKIGVYPGVGIWAYVYPKDAGLLFAIRMICGCRTNWRIK